MRRRHRHGAMMGCGEMMGHGMGSGAMMRGDTTDQ